jgi:hypothetical protein
MLYYGHRNNAAQKQDLKVRFLDLSGLFDYCFYRCLLTSYRGHVGVVLSYSWEFSVALITSKV